MAGTDSDPSIGHRPQSVHNEVSGTVLGSVIQAGSITIAYQARDLPPPHQLPAAPWAFVGRNDELGQITAALARASDDLDALAIAAITGAGGVGKTWLALHWAHQHIARFPDGQLYANLRGFDPSGEPIPSNSVLRGFLEALGVEPSSIPTQLDAQVGLYRSLVADKRMLVVLDNARDAAQVIPLLPGGGTCAVLVTSRSRMPALVLAHGAQPLTVDVLSPGEARELFARWLGPKRIHTEPDAIDELVVRCAGLPLALAIVAGRALAQVRLPLMTFAVELRDSAERLAALDETDPMASLASVLSWSYAALEPQQASLFELLGLAPGADIAAMAAASLAARPTADAKATLRELEQVSLIQQTQPGRYRMHDLIRLYAAEQATNHRSEEMREAALSRLVDFYVHSAHLAAKRLFPHHPAIKIERPVKGSHPVKLDNEAAAWVWLDTENSCALDVQRLAIEHGWSMSVWQLANSLDTFYRRRGMLGEALTAWQAGVAAAQRCGDQGMQALAYRGLGYTAVLTGRQQEGLEHLNRALILAEELADLPGQAHIHRALAQAWSAEQDYQRAFAHAERALQLARVLDDRLGEARGLNNVGWFSAKLGRFNEARAYCTAALSLCRELPHREVEGFTLDSMGYIAHLGGDYLEATSHYQQALTVMRELGHSYNEARTLDRLGSTYAALGRTDDACATWQQALDLYESQRRVVEAKAIRGQLMAVATKPD